MANAERTVPARGPVHPTASAAVAHRPLASTGADGSGTAGTGTAGRGADGSGADGTGAGMTDAAGSGVRLTSGLLHDWQQRNRAASLPLALRQLQAAGNLDNLRLAIAGTGEGYRGPAFMDSDIYKTLEAIGWELGHAADPGLAAFAAEVTSLLAKAQQADGYLNSAIQASGGRRYARLESSHELYCAGHLIQAAVAASRTFDDGLLDVARRFADHLVDVFLGREAGLDGHPIIETALVELYRQTGTPGYLQLATQFVNQRGHGMIGDSGFGIRYLQDHLPVRESPTEVGHVVRALYLESGAVDVAVETGDPELLAASIARWEDMVATKTALTGGNGSRHSGEAFGDAFELPPDRAYNETCAAIASFQWSWRLLLATGDARYADLMERVLYNGFAAALSADGRRFFYVNPLQRRDDHFEDDDPGRRREWFSCACCPPNIMRLMASLEHYIATVAGDVLYLHQLTGSQVSARLPEGDFALDITTSYPWTGTADLRVRRAPGAECGLAVRIPGWCRDASVSVNGQPVASAADEHGYLIVRRRWQPDDVLSLSMDVRPRLTYPNRRIDALRGTVAVERGPLTYCFEQADQPSGVSVEDLALSPAGAGGESPQGAAGGSAGPGEGGLTEREARLPGVGPTVIIEAAAVRLPSVSRGGLPYSPLPDERGGGPVTAVAVPYFQWDNRDGQAMRVWMPLSRSGQPATRDHPAASRAPLSEEA